MKKILVLGSEGLVGSALKRQLGDSHVYHKRTEVDLTDRNKTLDYITHQVKRNGVNTIINCAAKVGGVQANMKNNTGFFLDNFILNNNVIESAFRNEIPNFVNLLSTCIFPDKEVTYPLTPDQIDNGAPHFTNYGYSYAKRLAGYEMKIVKNVLKANWVSVIPTNVYGINDNYHLEEGHMVPAMIHRAFLARKNKEKMLVWGDGSPLRQLIYSDDLAKLILWSMDNWKSDDAFMAINPEEVTILETAKTICNLLNVDSEDLIFDDTKPKGQMRKPAITHAPSDFEFTPLKDGLKNTIQWFTENYPNIRK